MHTHEMYKTLWRYRTNFITFFIIPKSCKCTFFYWKILFSFHSDRKFEPIISFLGKFVTYISDFSPSYLSHFVDIFPFGKIAFISVSHSARIFDHLNRFFDTWNKRKKNWMEERKWTFLRHTSHPSLAQIRSMLGTCLLLVRGYETRSS